MMMIQWRAIRRHFMNGLWTFRINLNWIPSEEREHFHHYQIHRGATSRDNSSIPSPPQSAGHFFGVYSADQEFALYSAIAATFWRNDGFVVCPLISRIWLPTCMQRLESHLLKGTADHFHHHHRSVFVPSFYTCRSRQGKEFRVENNRNSSGFATESDEGQHSL